MFWKLDAYAIVSQAGPSRLASAFTSSKSRPISITAPITRKRQFSSTPHRSARTHGHSSHYDALTLPTNATKQQVKARFYELSKRYHPDAKGGDTSKFHEINDAYAILGDESKRRQYDLSLVPASQSRSRPPPHSASHSSFTPNDPYLSRNARGPHQAWNTPYNNNHSHPGQQRSHDQTYTPFGRKTPPNFQYEYTYHYNTSPNARRAGDMNRPGQGLGQGQRRKKGTVGEDEDETHAHAQTGGIWKFVVTVGMILTVISLGGGLTASAESDQEWDVLVNANHMTGTGSIASAGKRRSIQHTSNLRVVDEP